MHCIVLRCVSDPTLETAEASFYSLVAVFEGSYNAWLIVYNRMLWQSVRVYIILR